MRAVLTVVQTLRRPAPPTPTYRATIHALRAGARRAGRVRRLAAGKAVRAQRRTGLREVWARRCLCAGIRRWLCQEPAASCVQLRRRCPWLRRSRHSEQAGGMSEMWNHDLCLRFPLPTIRAGWARTPRGVI